MASGSMTTPSERGSHGYFLTSCLSREEIRRHVPLCPAPAQAQAWNGHGEGTGPLITRAPFRACERFDFKEISMKNPALASFSRAFAGTSEEAERSASSLASILKSGQLSRTGPLDWFEERRESESATWPGIADHRTTPVRF